MDEKTMVALAKAGDHRAFEEIVHLYEKKLYSIAYRFTGSEQDALDVCQETFIRVYRFIGGFQETSGFSTWIYRICTNVCKDSVTRRQRRGETSLDLQDEEGEEFELPVSDDRYSPERVIEQQELRRDLQAGIDALSPHHREIVVLRDVEGLSYEKISEVLGLEIGTVKSRLNRGREQLRNFLVKLDGNKSASSKSNK